MRQTTLSDAGFDKYRKKTRKGRFITKSGCWFREIRPFKSTEILDLQKLLLKYSIDQTCLNNEGVIIQTDVPRQPNMDR